MRRFFIGMRTKCSSPFVQEHSGRDASLGRYKSFPQGAVDAALSNRREDNESRNPENPRLLWGFAFRCFVRKTPKVVRRTANIQRLYGASHFGVSFAKHRKSFAEQRTFNAFIGLRISVFLAQNTESHSQNSEHSTLLLGFACRCFFRKQRKSFA